MMQNLVAHWRRRKIYIQAYAQTAGAGSIANGPVFIADEGDAAKVTEDIRAALNYAIRGIPAPGRNDWAAIQAPMLEATGTKTWSQMARGAKAVGIEIEGGVATFTPGSNYERQGGVGHHDRALKCPIADDRLGAVLQAAFAECDR